MRWIVVLAALVSVPAFAVENADGSLAKVPAELRKQFLNRLDLQLADGPSTRLRDIDLPTSPHQGLICGWINTKSRSGAYAGYQRFLYWPAIDEIYLSREMATDKRYEGARGLFSKTC